MLSEFFRSKERCYGNQKQAKIAQISLLCKILRNFSSSSKILGVSEFTYIIGIFKESEKVTTATEFKQTSAKIALISVLCKKSRNFNCGFLGSANKSMLPEFSMKQTALP